MADITLVRGAVTPTVTRLSGFTGSVSFGSTTLFTGVEWNAQVQQGATIVQSVKNYDNSGILDPPVVTTTAPYEFHLDVPNIITQTAVSGPFTGAVFPSQADVSARVGLGVPAGIYSVSIGFASNAPSGSGYWKVTNGQTFSIAIIDDEEPPTGSAPDAPSQPTKPGICEGAFITAMWNPVAGANSYNVYRNGVLYTNTDELSFEVSAPIGVTVSITVSAVNTYGESAPSPALIAVPCAVTDYPPPPAENQNSSLSCGTIGAWTKDCN